MLASVCMLALMAGPYEGENEVRCEGKFPLWKLRNSKPEIYQAGFKIEKVELYGRCESGPDICQRRLSYEIAKTKSWEFGGEFKGGAEGDLGSITGAMNGHYGEEE